MYWAVYVEKISAEYAEVSFYRSANGHPTKRPKDLIAAIETWVGEDRALMPNEVFPLLVNYFAKIACDAAFFAQGELLTLPEYNEQA
jgi:hypothetical protein